MSFTYRVTLLTMLNVIAVMAFDMPLNVWTWANLLFLDIGAMMILNAVFGGEK